MKKLILIFLLICGFIFGQVATKDLTRYAIGFPDSTYKQVLHVEGGVTDELKPVYDGDGTELPLLVSTSKISVLSGKMELPEYLKEADLSTYLINYLPLGSFADSVAVYLVDYATQDTLSNYYLKPEVDNKINTHVADVAAHHTKLNEAEVDAFVSNNGYITVEIDPVFSNWTKDYNDLINKPVFTPYDNHLINDQDLSDTNELNTSFSLNGNSLELTDAGGIKTVDLSQYVSSDEQNLSAVLTGNILTINIENGAGVNVDLTNLINDADFQIDNEIQDLQLVGNILSITLNGTATNIDLSQYLDDTDTHADQAEIEAMGFVTGAHTVDTKLSEAEVDAFADNNGYLTTEIDGSTTNEIELPPGGTDGQVLKTDGVGNYAWISLSDSLWNHIATQNIALNSYWLSNDGSDEGIKISSTDGRVGINTTTFTSSLNIGGDRTVRFVGGAGVFAADSDMHIAPFGSSLQGIRLLYSDIRFNGFSGGGSFNFRNTDALNKKTIIVQAVANQTHNLAEFQNESAVANTVIQSDGSLKLGDSAKTTAGTIKFDGTHFYGYNGSAWVQLDN